MKSKWLTTTKKYDGEQLKPLANYLDHDLLGDSIVAWQGACDVTPEHMIDGEDLKVQALIQSEQMLHFVLEIFDFSLRAGVALQRLMAGIVRDTLCEMSSAGSAKDLQRKGDDLYLGDKKFNVSIATCTRNSTLIHFGLNIKNEGTPVPTCALEDFGLKASDFASEVMKKICAEVEAIHRASQKVRQF